MRGSDSDSSTAALDAQIAALKAKKAAKVARSTAARAVLRAKEEAEEGRTLVGATPTKKTLGKKDDRPPSPPPQPTFATFGQSTGRNTSSGAVAVAGPSRPRTSAPAPAPATGPPSAGSTTRQPLPSLSSLPSLNTRPSGLSASLAALRRTSNHSSAPPSHPVDRPGKAIPTASASRGDRPRNEGNVTNDTRLESQMDGVPFTENGNKVQRDDESLTVLEHLTPGPREFGKDPEGGDEWLAVEPNSGIRLIKRILPHAAVQQDVLYGRYYLPPSMLYSVIRLSRSGGTYDVPVEGEWVTIAVVAERGDVKVSGTREGGDSGSDSDMDMEDGIDDSEPKHGHANTQVKKPTHGHGVNKSQKQKGSSSHAERNRRKPRKYLNLKLVALPPRSGWKNGASAGMGAAGGGDAVLRLLLFQADHVVMHDKKGDVDDEEGQEVEYRGGSGGAYERWGNLSVGSVIALISPEVLRPLHSGSSAPHPLTLPLALNPSRASSIELLGHARDLGTCSSLQRDGTRCRTWVDTRQGGVCEYHVAAAVKRVKGARAEFTAGTGGFVLTSGGDGGGMGRNKANGGAGGGGGYDAQRKTGLLPRSGMTARNREQQYGEPNGGGGGATYIVGGATINTRTNSHGRTGEDLRGLGDEHLSEKLGRSTADRKRRKREAAEEERALERLLGDAAERNGTAGGKYLEKVRRMDLDLNLDLNGQGAGKRVKGTSSSAKSGSAQKQKDQTAGLTNGGQDAQAGQQEEGMEKKRVFHPEAVKRIGFDPTGRGLPEDREKRAQSLKSLKEGGGRLVLGRPKGLGRSSVRAPTVEEKPAVLVPLGLPEGEGSGREGEMVDLD